MKKISTVLDYLDCFGANFNFYIEKNRKLYTPFGGILTILSLIVSIIIFTYIYLDDFLHNNPSSTTSTEKSDYRQIKSIEEKYGYLGVFVTLGVKQLIIRIFFFQLFTIIKDIEIMNLKV